MKSEKIMVSVSVVVAARNEEINISEALTSIVMQENVDFEIIYVDDHSEDGSIEIVRKLAEKYPRIRVVVTPKRGKCSAFNYGVSISTGRFHLHLRWR